LKNIKEDEKELPHVILVDGGMQQVQVVKNIVPECISVLGIAKERKNDRVRRAKGDVLDKIYTEKGRIEVGADILHFFQKLRDEAHRFALNFHRTKRRKMTLTSLLDRMDGIAQVRKQLLLKHFGSVETIAKADCSEVARVGKINIKQAYHLIERLREIS
jgi:excinuclease ABC subunit C